MDNNGIYIEVTKMFRQRYDVVFKQVSQSAITCSKLSIETLEQGVKYIQS